MSYFSDSYDNLRFPVAEDGKRGLRRAQLGAIHNIGGYFSQPQRNPGIVVMPTGSGKTAVICVSAFLLRAQRVLILTPSQLVRSQIAEELASLTVLKRTGVLPEDFVCPKVNEVKGRLTSTEMWEELKEYDFIVSTPQCVSPGIEDVAVPPGDLFDLVLMDEAHHSEAPRWADILSHFANTKRLLFTATPFRRDKKELKGHMVYNYPLRLAHEDGIFGKLRFIPVDPGSETDHDIAIARRAEAVYRKDRANGFDHRLMVRTDSKKRSEDLAEIYKSSTKLNLVVVHSGHVLKTIRKTLQHLKAGEIDGIICVAMMGEGFDFPQLKIAAIHSPHKSLAVTLQFIGRFARTSGDKLGEAKFLAVPQDIQAETNELYKESAAWQDIVANLSAAKIEREVRIKELAASFETIEMGDADGADVMLTDCKPYFHVKIYKLSSLPDLKTLPELDNDISVLRHEISEEHSSSILLLRQVTRPRWTDLERFSRVEYDLIVFYYDETSKCLFINSSRRSLEFYRIFEDHYGKGTAALIPGPRINRVLEGLQNPDFFSVGLKNSVQNSNTESYQIKAGPSAQNAISHSDALLFQRGHLFGKGVDERGEEVTIGYSSSSKVWSNYSARVGELIEWCQRLARKLETKGRVLTGTPLDALEVGDEVDTLLNGVIGVGWSDNVFREFPRARITSGGAVIEAQLLDLEISLLPGECSEHLWTVELNHRALDHPAKITFQFLVGRPVFGWMGVAPDIKVIWNEDEVPLIDYLGHYPLVFFLEDFSRMDGATVFYNKNGREVRIDDAALLKLDWKSARIAIDVEFPADGVDFAKPKTVQEFLGQHLIASTNGIVFYDHGSGEMADFLTFEEGANNSIIVRLYHCKGAGGKAPGDRVGDAYEVCGQVVKCLVWLKNRQALRRRIEYREHSTGGKSHIIKGDRNELQRLLADEPARKMEIEIIVVQPGIPIGSISDKIGHVLGAASDYIRRAIGAKMLLIGS